MKAFFAARRPTPPSALADEGMPIKQIVRRTGCSRRVIQRIVRGGRNGVVRVG